MSKTFVALMTLALSGTAFSAAATPPDAVRVARYTELVGADRSERDPLAVVASLRFPRDVVITVGDGLRYLFQRTGYSVVAGDSDAEHLFALPLPESHRQLGPHPVQVMAQILAGEAFAVCSSARQRLVTVAVQDDLPNATHCESRP